MVLYLVEIEDVRQNGSIVQSNNNESNSKDHQNWWSL